MNNHDMAGFVSGLRSTFNTGRTRPLSWRREQLGRLRAMIAELEGEIHAALEEDLGKPSFESWLGETGFVTSEIDYAAKRLGSWMKPRRVRTPILNQPGSSYVRPEPLGVALIIGAWNYPFLISIMPLVGAIAAGNCAVVKPSEISAGTSAVIARGVRDYLDGEAIRVVEGGVPETTDLLKEQFDYIFYTGGGIVGRIVMEAAARNLTPVTLELGGKSPCLVDRGVDLEVAARRIAWGRFLNAGQTCVAPDYVLAHEEIEEELLDHLKSTVRRFYGADPRQSPDYARIVNEKHFGRLEALLGSGEVVTGGQTDASDLYIAPTILRNVAPDSPVMAEEIFGPILPVLAVPGIEAAISFVNARPRPQALYLFSRDEGAKKGIIEHTSSGSVCINDVVVHMLERELPFGGVGPSGMGAYTGRASFETFSHRKSVLKKSLRFDVPLRYPPYSDSKLKWLKRLV